MPTQPFRCMLEKQLNNAKDNDLLLDIKNLKKYFSLQRTLSTDHNHLVRAVDGVNLSVHEEETLGLVGESGCGKTTLGRLIARLETPTEGEIIFNGNNIAFYSGKNLKHFRKEVQLIFQDPYTSLNPRMNVASIIGEPLAVHNVARGKELKDRVIQLMSAVGLTKEQMERYPHQFSGGQRQRIGIARALALNPKLIIADEPVSALDVSIQAQILNLLKSLQQRFGLTYLFISHDLSVVKHMSNRIAVMYLGKIVELSNNKSIYTEPFHPYTKALIAAIPSNTPFQKKQRVLLKDDTPSPLHPPSGCAFHPRCPFRTDMCEKVIPKLSEKTSGHFAACHLDVF